MNHAHVCSFESLDVTSESSSSPFDWRSQSHSFIPLMLGRLGNSMGFLILMRWKLTKKTIMLKEKKIPNNHYKVEIKRKA